MGHLVRTLKCGMTLQSSSTKLGGELAKAGV